MARETKFSDYWGQVESDADLFVRDNWNEIKSAAMDGDYTKRGRKTAVHLAEENLYEFLDQHIDLHEAADILDQCKEEAWDYGMFGHDEPEKTVCSKAFYSFCNDVRNAIRDTIEEKLNELYDEQLKILEGLEEELNQQEELLSELEHTLDENDESEEQVAAIEAKIEEIKQKISELEDKVSDQEYATNNVESAIESL
jgi:DNA repair exonuclease SbcCD ATPase subunit